MRGLADEVIENEGGASRLDLLQQALDARVAEGQVALPQHPAVYVANQVAGNAVQLPPPDVIGTEQEGIAPEARYDEVQQRRSEEHTSELQSRENLVCRLLLEKKK